MPVIKIRRGLDLPIHGAADGATVVERLDIEHVGLVPGESVGMKCRPLVEVGAKVEIGSPLYVDRRDPDVVHTSPASGTVTAIHRGERRVVQSIVIRRDGKNSAVAFDVPRLEKADGAAVRQALLGSGLWGALRQRPFDVVPRHDAVPGAIVVTAIDTRPLAPTPRSVLAGREAAFRAGLEALRRLTSGTTYLCVRAGEDWSALGASGVEVAAFDGPHPAGTPGLHIHKLHPVGAKRTAWHVGYQDVADIGQFFTTGRVPSERVVAIVGPAATAPRLVRTRRGASMAELLANESSARDLRAISGSVFEGRETAPGTPFGFLGRFANQVTLLENETSRRLISWALPLDGRYTHTNTLWDKFVRRRLVFDTDTNGSLRAFVPIGQYESVMPFDVLPTQLVKALATGDVVLAEKLGVLEFAEEDIALCEYVDNSKQPLTAMLREMLDRIEKEG
jgi:Na+-transporting NADH:ubiquinone oxidoreductase subunit A